MAVISRNQLVVIPAGTKFQVAGVPSEAWAKMATNTLATLMQAQGVEDLGGGLGRSPVGFYVRLAELAYDEAGAAYEARTVLFLAQHSSVQVVVRVGGGKGVPLQVLPGRPHPTSAQAMASGIAMTAAATIIFWSLVG